MPDLRINPLKLLKYAVRALDWETLIEWGFRDPDEPEKPFQWLPWQRRAVRKIQYSKKRGFMALAPRGYAKSTLFQLCSCAACIAPPWPYTSTKVAYFSIGLDESLRSVSVTEGLLLNSKFARLLPKKHDKKLIPFVHNGSYIRAYPQSEGVRGGRFHYIIFDEWSRLLEDFVKGTCRRLLAKIGVKEIGGSTPFGASGDFYEMWTLDVDNNLEPYDRVEVQDIKEFSDEGVLVRFESEIPWMTQQEYLQQRIMLGPIMADQELDAVFLGTGATLVRHDWIKQCYDYKKRIPWLDHERPQWGDEHYCTAECEDYMDEHGHSVHRWWDNIPKIISGDFGRDNDYWVYMIMSRLPVQGQKMKMCVHWIERGRMGSYPDIEDVAINLMKRFNVYRGIFDGNGVGEPVLDHIVKKAQEEGLNVSYWKTATQKLDEPGKPESRRLRLGYLSSGRFSKQDLVDGVTKGYYGTEMLVPYHFDDRQLGDDRYYLWEHEKELINYQFKIDQSKKTRKRSIIYGVQPYHDDIFMTEAMGILCLKYARYGHFDNTTAIGQRTSKKMEQGKGRAITSVGHHAVGRRGPRDRF